MKKINNFLDNEERNLIKSLETEEWKSVKNIESWKTMLSNTATSTITIGRLMEKRS